jgi:hypothetical protein
MLPHCTINSRCWRQVCAELDRVRPAEGLAVPLVTLTPRRADFNPCTPLELEDLGAVLIAAAVLVPEDRQVNRAARVSVLPDTNRRVNRRVEKLVSWFPRLRPCAYLHSHPFARGGTWPSRGPGCDYDGHMLPLLERNKEAGLNTSFSFIACRSGDDRSWELQAFALDWRRQIVDLGVVEPVDERDRAVQEALARGLTSRHLPRVMLRQWRRELDLRRLRYKVDELFDGWTRTIVHANDSTAVVALLPIDFPERLPSFFCVSKADGRSRPLTAPGSRLRTPEGWCSLVDEVTRACSDRESPEGPRAGERIVEEVRDGRLR